MHYTTTLTTLRSRLTFWYIISTITIFALLAILFSLLLWVTLHNQIDHHIHIVTGQAQQVVADFQAKERQKLLSNLVGFEGMSIVIISQAGKVLLESHSPDVAALNTSELLQIYEASQKYTYHPIHFTSNSMRFGIVEVTDGGVPALLAVGYSVTILRQTFYQMMSIVLGVMVITLLPFTFVGHRLLKKYLYPLEAIAKTVQQVTQPKQLSMRITGLAVTEELKTIVTSFNTMLSQLEKIFHTEHEVFSQAAHTLKTPLAVLRAKVEGLTKESRKNKQAMLQMIDAAGETIQDLLLISRIETGSENLVKRINLSTTARKLVELAEELAQEKQAIVTNTIQNSIFFTTDESLLKRALGNVVHNALEYVDKHGSVHVALQQEKGRIIFMVTNTGVSVSDKELPHLFDRFYRGTNSQQNKHGSGLGLAITKAVVEKYGGQIKFRSLKAATQVTVIFKEST